MKYADAKAAARGIWPSVLVALGVPAEHLVDRHGPCPACGGRDRFRFDDRDGDGTFYCSSCGAGDGFDLLQRVHGWDGKRALEEVGKAAGLPEVRNAPRNVRPGKGDPAKMREAAARITRAKREAHELTGSDPATRYLQGRGLPRRSWHDLLYHEGLLGSGLFTPAPALLAIVRGPDGYMRTLHRTFLDAQGHKARMPNPKQLMPVVGTKDSDTWLGGAVRLYPLKGERLVVAEGIETALAAAELMRAPAWATISAGGLEAFIPPEGVRHVTVAVDNDENGTGQAAGHALAARLWKQGISADVALPARAGTDWLDEWVAANADEGAA